MLTQEKIDRFYLDVEALGLKFPIAAISEATGDDKSNVSKYLNKKKEPSEEFIERFYEKFESSIKVVSREITVTAADTKEEILGMLKMSLMANIDHAAANKRNAASGDKNAESLQELVKLLGLKLSSSETGSASKHVHNSDIGKKKDQPKVLSGRKKPHSVAVK